MMIKKCNQLIWQKHAHGMNKDLVCKKEEIKCNNIIKQYKNVKLWLYYKRRHKKT